MAIGPRLEFRQSQTLVMTPQLRQAIKLLQFTNFEVNAFVEEELERNPLLERDELGDAMPEACAPDQRRETLEALDASDLLRREKLPDVVEADHANNFDLGGVADGGVTDGPAAFSRGGGGGGGFDLDDHGMDDFAGRPRCLREHLEEQLRLSFANAADRLIGAHLIASIDPAGRLAASSCEIAQGLGAEPAHVERVRGLMMQSFDPPGLFARDLRECLAAQLADRNRLDPAMEMLLDNLDLLARRELRRLTALCGVDAEDLADMIAEIRALDPKPGVAFDDMESVTVVPDVLMRAGPGGTWLLELNPETMPRVLVNQSFHAKVAPAASREDRVFLSEQLSSANWLVKSLQQRAQTIVKVAAEIVRRQDAFFERGVAHLRPLILRDIADAVEMHESTVSRVTANKYIATPRGTFELKYFFTTAIAATYGGESHSAEAVRQRIRSMVAAETADDVLSDDAIVAALRSEGVDIARRTVAKYRDALRIPSSVQRKREKALPA
jgi:RNA polymerase sigma-54 factor